MKQGSILQLCCVSFIHCTTFHALAYLQAQLTGKALMRLAICRALVMGTVAFEMIEIIGNILFSWCFEIGLLSSMSVLTSLMALRWHSTQHPKQNWLRSWGSFLERNVYLEQKSNHRDCFEHREWQHNQLKRVKLVRYICTFPFI